jgi:N6-L-threonylcarbamoyladenine synthase
MLVYVLNQESRPLMPCNSSKARKLLKQNKAKIKKKSPFTIQLLYVSSGYIQPIALGVDAGSKFIGLSATTNNQELFSAEVELRNDIVDLLSDRRQYRKSRRNRTTRYRKPRFLNRVKSRNKGWLAPSVENKIQTHFNIISKIYQILPISKIIVEVASFDIYLGFSILIGLYDITGIKFGLPERLLNRVILILLLP